MSKNVVAEAAVRITSNTKDFRKDLVRAVKMIRTLRSDLRSSARENRRLKEMANKTGNNFRKAARSTRRFSRNLITARAALFAIERGSFRIWRSMTAGIGRVIRFARNLALVLGGIGIGATLFALKTAASFETVQVQLAVLTGSSKKAREQMEKLKQFSARTPFQFKEIADAAKNFQLMGGAVLNTMKNIKFFGDAATFAKEGYGFADIALWVGRLHSELERGSRAIGKVTLGLMRAGVLSGKARGEMEGLARAGASASAIWKVMTNDMKRFEGGMERNSRTLAGLYSTLKDNVILAFEALGSAIKPIAKFWMVALIRRLQQLHKNGTLKEWAAQIAKAFEKATVFLVNFIRYVEKNWDPLWKWAKGSFSDFYDWFKSNTSTLMWAAIGYFGMMVPGVKSILTTLIGLFVAFDLSGILKAIGEATEADWKDLLLRMLSPIDQIERQLSAIHEIPAVKLYVDIFLSYFRAMPRLLESYFNTSLKVLRYGVDMIIADLKAAGGMLQKLAHGDILGAAQAAWGIGARPSALINIAARELGDAVATYKQEVGFLQLAAREEFSAAPTVWAKIEEWVMNNTLIGEALKKGGEAAKKAKAALKEVYERIQAMGFKMPSMEAWEDHFEKMFNKGAKGAKRMEGAVKALAFSMNSMSLDQFDSWIRKFLLEGGMTIQMAAKMQGQRGRDARQAVAGGAMGEGFARRMMQNAQFKKDMQFRERAAQEKKNQPTKKGQDETNKNLRGIIRYMETPHGKMNVFGAN